MACSSGNCSCGRCSSPGGSCSSGVVRLDHTTEAGAGEAEEGCPRVFADFFAGEGEEEPAGREPAAGSPTARTDQGEDALRVEPGPSCLHVMDPCNPNACNYNPAACEKLRRQERAAPAAWSARRAGPAEAALAVLGLAVGGSLIHHAFTNP